MKTIELKLKPGRVPEWETEDLLIDTFSDTFANEEQIKEMLNHIQISLPKDINYKELAGYVKMNDNPFNMELPSDTEKYNYFLVEIPLNILVAENHKLIRLRLKMNLIAEGLTLDSAVAYDLFPSDRWEDKITSIGDVNIDLSKMFGLIFKQPITDALGFKLGFPLKWKSQYVQIRTSDRMSNPVEWYITDQAIDNGFTGYAILRTPKNATININAEIACEIRKSGLLGRMLKTRFVSDAHSYVI